MLRGGGVIVSRMARGRPFRADALAQLRRDEAQIVALHLDRGGLDDDVSRFVGPGALKRRLDGKNAVAAALEGAQADAAANLVVDVYAIAVAEEAGRLVPAKLRERIRATGPTTGNSRLHAAADAPAA